MPVNRCAAVAADHRQGAGVPSHSLALLASLTLFLTIPTMAAWSGDDPPPVDPWADEIVSYDPGVGAASGFTNPEVALGEPARMTGFPSPTAQAVTPFVPPHHNTQVVSIGTGGHLTVRFHEPVVDHPLNPYGVDLLIFGNSLFAEADFFDQTGTCGSPCGIFSEGGIIEISADGESWVTIEGLEADGLFPTNAFLDLASAYSSTPGNLVSNYTRPVDPALSLADFAGLTYPQMLDLYAGSGGGAGLDIGAYGFDAISYVRISNPDGAAGSPEIDALARVTPVLAGDVTGDGTVDVQDLLLVISNWGATGPIGGLQGDANRDGVVDVQDLLAVISQWGQSV